MTVDSNLFIQTEQHRVLAGEVCAQHRERPEAQGGLAGLGLAGGGAVGMRAEGSAEAGSAPAEGLGSPAETQRR